MKKQFFSPKLKLSLGIVAAFAVASAHAAFISQEFGNTITSIQPAGCAPNCTSVPSLGPFSVAVFLHERQSAFPIMASDAT